MKCPICDAGMQPGTVVIRSDLESLLIAGHSHLHGWFHLQEGGPADRVLWCGQPSHAHRCPGCGPPLLVAPDAIERRDERTRRREMAGKAGVSTTDLAAIGEVLLGGRTFVARAEGGYIGRGRRVEVVEVGPGRSAVGSPGQRL